LKKARRAAANHVFLALGDEPLRRFDGCEPLRNPEPVIGAHSPLLDKVVAD
jgi:hypothetical protein